MEREDIFIIQNWRRDEINYGIESAESNGLKKISVHNRVHKSMVSVFQGSNEDKGQVIQ